MVCSDKFCRFAPGIMMMEIVTIFFPIFDVYKSRSQLRLAFNTIKEWEKKHPGGPSTIDSHSGKHTSSSISLNEKKPGSTVTSMSSRRGPIYAMATFEKCLATNAIPLLHFAAFQEFTGENIVFLMQVRDWRDVWKQAQQGLGSISGQIKQELFSTAVSIYTTRIHDTANFPINIEGKIRSQLDSIFGPAVGDLGKNLMDNVVDPFSYQSCGDLELAKLHRRSGPLRDVDSASQENILSSAQKRSTVEHCDLDSTMLPKGFDEHVFDAAEKSVKYMVLTNTWPKFVDWSKEQDIWV